MNTFRKSRVHSNDLLFFIFSSPLITFLPESILIQKGKKLLIGLSPNNEIVKVELPRIKNAQTPPVGIDKSFLQTNQKKMGPYNSRTNKLYRCILDAESSGSDIVWSFLGQKLDSDFTILGRSLAWPVLWVTLKKKSSVTCMIRDTNN